MFLPARDRLPVTRLMPAHRRRSSPPWAVARLEVPIDRQAFTLLELMIGMMLTTMLAFMLAGMIVAVGLGWDHCAGLDSGCQQARVSIDRIQYMISQAGTYQLAGQRTVLGLAIVD